MRTEHSFGRVLHVGSVAHHNVFESYESKGRDGEEVT